MLTHLHHFFLLRRPVLPQQSLDSFHQTVGDDITAFHQELLKIFSDPFLIDSLFLASPSLFEALQKLQAGTQIKNAHKTYLTLYRYVIRMSTRCTPFGLFAGTVSAEFGSQTFVQISSLQQAKAVCRLDAGAAYHLCQSWQAHPDLIEQFLFYPNSSLMRGPGHYRYLERTTSETAPYSLTEVKHNSYLEAVLLRAGAGARIPDLREALTHMNIAPDQAQIFINSLIASQLLVSELDGLCNREDFLEHMSHIMADLKNAEKQLLNLKNLQDLIVNRQPLREKVRQVAKCVNSIAVGAAADRTLLQTNLFFPKDRLVLERKMVKRILADFSHLSVLNERLQQTELLEFAKAFYLRYQDRQVSLLTALDPDTGIGYGQGPLPLTEQIISDIATKEIYSAPQDLSALDSFRLEMLCSSLQTKQTVIEISTQNLETLPCLEETDGCFSGEGTYLMGSILSDSPTAFEQGDFKFLLLANGGPTAFSLMTRFCHDDQVLDRLVTQGMSWEELSYPEYVFAEISHLSDFGSANISATPSRRMRHINYLGSRGQSNQHQLLPEDLYVSVTEAFEVILFSKTLNKRVIPRLTSAHDYRLGVPVYKFLGDLSHQSQGPYLNWNWGFLSHQPFLPRLQFNHLILSPASWNIPASVFESRGPEQLSPTDRWKKLASALDLPVRFWLPRGDNQLLIDSRNKFALEVFFDYLKTRKTVRITECIEDFGNGLLSKQDKTFFNEVVIPLLIKNKSRSHHLSVRSQIELIEQREFLPGSPWLYLKIYCSPRTAEHILTEFLYPLMKALLLENTIDRWFYVRYSDSDHHIRLRAHVPRYNADQMSVLRKINKGLSVQCYYGSVSKIIIDTYQRELERYEGLSYQSVECIFYFDSVCTLDLLCSEPLLPKQHIALHSINLILDNFGFTLPEKQKFCGLRLKALQKELNADMHMLNRKFRTERDWVQQALNASVSYTQRDIIRSFFSARTAALTLAITKLSNPQKQSALAASFVHMHLNRLFEGEHQAQELLLYHYLQKGYGSQLARMNNKTKSDKSLDM